VFNAASVGALNTTVAGATVSNVEIVNLQGLAGITTNTTTWGTKTLNVTNAVAGNVDVTVAAGTATTAGNTAAGGTVTVRGGATQNIVAAGQVVSTGASAAVNVAASALGTATVTVDNGTDVTVSATGLTSNATVDQIIIGGTTAPTGAVAVTASGELSADTQALGDVVITGGSSVAVNTSASADAALVTATRTSNTTVNVAHGDVVVNGTANTTSVSVTQAAARAAVASATVGVVGIQNGDVAITDVNSGSATLAGKITTVSLTNFDDATVNSGALTTLNVTGNADNLTVTSGALTTPTVAALALNLNSVTATSTFSVDNDYTTLNISNTGAASTINTLTAGGATTVNVSGDKLVTLTTQNLTAATAINVTNTAGVTFGNALAVGAAFTSAGGVETITLGAQTKAVATGAGNDVITLTSLLGTGGSVNAGDGTGDVLNLTAAVADAIDTTATRDAISNFEVLQIGNAGAATSVNVSNLDSLTTIISAGAGAGTLALTNLAANTTITFTGDLDSATSAALNTATGTADVLNVKFAASLIDSGATFTANAIETINVTVDDTDTAAPTAAFVQTIAADAVKTLTVTGDVGLNLGTLAGTTLTNFNASGVTATGAVGAVTLTTGALAAAATLTGGAGDDVISAAAAVAAVTLSGGAGADTLNGGTVADTINGGIGNDIIAGNNGGDTLSGEAGSDLFVYGAAAQSNGVNQDTITDFLTGTDKVALSAGTGVAYAGEANGYGAVLTSLTGVAYQAVLDTTTSTLYVDVDGDAALTAADVSIKLNGVTDLSQSDFALIGTTGADAALNGGANADTIYGLEGADVITAGAGIDTIITGAGADQVILNQVLTANRDIVTDFTAGAGGDELVFDISDFGLAGGTEFVGALGSVAVDSSEEIVVLTGAGYATDEAAETALAGRVTTDGLDVVVVYFNTTDNTAHVIYDTDAGVDGTGTAVLVGQITNITTQTAFDTLTAANVGSQA
jgi:S-layer protein